MLELDIFHKCRGNLTLHPSSKSEGRHEPSRFDLSQMQPLSSLGNSNQLYNHTTNTAWDGRLPQQVDILSECGTPTRPWFLPITKLHASSAAKLDISSGYDPSLQDMLRRLQQWKLPDDLEPEVRDFASLCTTPAMLFIAPDASDFQISRHERSGS
jgi:hypothetical protein